MIEDVSHALVARNRYIPMRISRLGDQRIIDVPKDCHLGTIQSGYAANNIGRFCQARNSPDGVTGDQMTNVRRIAIALLAKSIRPACG